MSLILPPGCALPCLFYAVSFCESSYLEGAIEELTVTAVIPRENREEAYGNVDRRIRKFVAKREARLSLHERRRVRLVASIMKGDVDPKNRAEAVFRVKLFRAEDLMRVPSLRVHGSFYMPFPYRYAELAQGWDSLLTYVRMGEALDRAHARALSTQETADLFAVMRELFRLWSDTSFHYIKTYRYTTAKGRRLHPFEEDAVDVPISPETRAYMARRFPQERHLGWAALKMLEEGVRELHQLMAQEPEDHAMRIIRDAMDDPDSTKLVLYRGFPMNDDALEQLNRPCKLFGWLHEWSVMAHVARPFSGEYGVHLEDGVAALPCMQILELEQSDRVAALPVCRFMTRTHELECMVSTPPNSPLRVVAASIVCTTGRRAGAKLHFRQSRPLAPNELLEGFRRAMIQFKGHMLLVLLMSPREENLEEAHVRLKDHCERLWGVEGR